MTTLAKNDHNIKKVKNVGFYYIYIFLNEEILLEIMNRYAKGLTL